MNSVSPISAPDASADASAHPEYLRQIDRRYIVAWGEREVLVSTVTTLALSALFAWLAAVMSPLWSLALVPVVITGAFAILFFRNPRRRVPEGPGLLVSPADGTVWDVETVEDAEFVGEPCVRIGIFLSIFSVHVNRAPAAGRVAWLRYRPGAFHDARSSECATENESNSIGFDYDEPGRPAARLLVRQVSGAVARRIICPLAVSTPVARGGLLGMIKYGSRTELWVPTRLEPEIRVRVGQKVAGGETVLAVVPETGGAPHVDA